MNISISRKLLIFYLAIIVVMALVIFLSLISTITLGRTIQELIEYNFDKLDLVLELRTDSALEDAWASAYIMTQDPADLEQVKQARNKYSIHEGKLSKKIAPGRESSLFSKIKKQDKLFDFHTDEAINLIQTTGDIKQARPHLKHRARTNLDESIEKLEFVVEGTAEKRVQEANQYIQRSIITLFILASILILIIMAGGIWIAKGFKAVAGRIADGSNKLSLSSAEIAATSEEMSQGVESQLERVIDTSSAMEEMSLSIKEVSQSAQGASDSVSQVSNQVKENTTKIKDTIKGVKSASEAVNKLRDRSEEIGKVIKLISEIAAQTNILALNAAIEAARAGEYGKGFDVVAEEIRKLAQRTAKSTSEIAPIIEEIQRETQDTADTIREKTELAAEVGVNFDLMAKRILEATSMTSSISSTAAQQAKTAEQIADSLQLISQVSRETSKNTGETAAATHDLAELAQRLKEVIAQLKAA